MAITLTADSVDEMIKEEETWAVYWKWIQKIELMSLHWLKIWITNCAIFSALQAVLVTVQQHLVCLCEKKCRAAKRKITAEHVQYECSIQVKITAEHMQYECSIQVGWLRKLKFGKRQWCWHGYYSTNTTHQQSVIVHVYCLVIWINI